MNDFKNQSPWGTPPGGNGNGDGGFRRGPTPPNVDEIVKNLQSKINKFFPGGGRSRTGLSLPSRPGLLSLIIRSFASLRDQNVKIVPVYIGYEKIL